MWDSLEGVGACCCPWEHTGWGEEEKLPDYKSGGRMRFTGRRWRPVVQRPRAMRAATPLAGLGGKLPKDTLLQLGKLPRWIHFYNYSCYVNLRWYQTGPPSWGFLSWIIVVLFVSQLVVVFGFVFPLWGSLPCFVKWQFGASLAAVYVWAVISSHGLISPCEFFLNSFGYI